MQNGSDGISQDEQLLDQIFEALTKRVPKGDPYSWDGSYAARIRELPTSLCAMAATHHLDVSLTMDTIDWHFCNFGEPALVKETEGGLRRLGLEDLANVFMETHELVLPHLEKLRAADDNEVYLKEAGLMDRVDRLRGQAFSLISTGSRGVMGSAIYASWVRHARAHPDEVFG